MLSDELLDMDLETFEGKVITELETEGYDFGVITDLEFQGFGLTSQDSGRENHPNSSNIHNLGFKSSQSKSEKSRKRPSEIALILV